MACAWRVVHLWGRRWAPRTLTAFPPPARSARAGRGVQASPQAPAKRQRECEGISLLPVHSMELEPRASRVLEHLGAGPAQVILVAARDGDEPAQPHLAVARRQLGLAAQRSLVGLALASRLQLTETVAQLPVGAIPGDRRLDLAGGALRGERLEGDRHGPDCARASKEGVHEQRRYLDPGPAADPVGGVHGAVALVVIPSLARGKRPRARLREAISVAVGRLQCGELCASERVKRGPQGTRE